jgi:hypothetical protein
MDVDVTHQSAGVPSGQNPGGDVGVMIHPRDEDFIARLKSPADGPAQVQGKRSHIRAKYDFARRGRIDQVGNGDLRLA